MFEFKLPDLGEGIHEGEILKWHVQPGGAIKEDDPLVDVETDKAAVTIPSPKGGVVVSLAVEVGKTAKVGDVIVTIDESGSGTAAAAKGAAPVPSEPAPADLKAPAAPAPGPKTSAAKAPVGVPAPAPAPASAPASTRGPAAPVRTGPVPAAPATRRLARELGVDLNLVPSSGPGGRVTAEDVQRFAQGGGAAVSAAAPAHDAGRDESEAGAGTAFGAVSGIPYYELEPLPDFAAQGPVEREPVRSIRRKVAKKMVTSMVTVPHVAHIDEADVSELEAFRKRAREQRAGQPGSKLSLLPFVVKAAAATLAEFKMFNASLDPQREEIVYKKFWHVGVAVDSGRGLVVPVIKDVDRKSILEIAIEIEDLAGKARAGKLDANDMRGGTFTITNVGPLGGTVLIPTINYPEVAILGMAMAKPKPVVHDGQIVARTILPLTLAFDHRVADGADAARFMNTLIRRLSDPLSWLLTS